MPLPSKDSKKGRGGGGPERKEEVADPIAKLFGCNTIVAADGSTGFQAAAKDANKPSLKGVSHITKVFTPVTKLLKSKLSQGEIKLLRRHCKGEQPAVKETALYFVLAAGDNAAENITGHIKNTMRRFGNLGRNNATHDETKNVQTLAAAALLRHAGVQTVFDVLKRYRLACSTGVVSTSPKDAFSMKTVRKWMFKPPAQWA